MICACFPEIEGEHEVTVSDKQFLELSTQVAEMRGSLKAAVWIIGILSAAATAAGIGAIAWCFNLSNAVAKLQQAVSDGGVTKLVSELKLPSSPDQLKANLSTVIAQVQTAKVNGAKPDPHKVKALSDAVSDVISDNPQLPEGWRAASQLVSFRAGRNAPPQPDCFNKPHFGVMNAWMGDTSGPKVPAPMANVWEMDNCTMVLDDIDLFLKSEDGKALEADRRAVPQRPLFIRLMHAHLVYHGGPVIPFTRLECISCTYEWDLSAPPPDLEKKLTNDLLRADNYADVKIEGAM